MNLFILTNPGLEQLAIQEIKEVTGLLGIASPQVVELEGPSELQKGLLDMQSIRRVLLGIWRGKKIEDFLAPETIPWSLLFTSETVFTIEIENVKGQDNRTVISKLLAKKMFDFFEKKKIAPKLDFKHPQQMITVFFNGEEYFVGLDIFKKELNARSYRIFPHSGTFKGDFGYFFVRTSGFQPGENLLVGFVKDGTLAIEAARYAKARGNANKTISAFDVSQPNLIAARKNATLAGVRELIDINKYALDELDVKYGENVFDRLLFFITQKDEDKINELYYQAKYILKQKGTLLLIGRKSWDVSPYGSFTLLHQGQLNRGDSTYAWWLLEKK